MRTSSFQKQARQQQAAFLANDTGFTPGARALVDARAIDNPYLLGIGHEWENLYPALRSSLARDHFADRRIKWWKAPASGDITDVDGPTRNLASSQLACVNFLLPLADHLSALACLLQHMEEDVKSVEVVSHTPPGSKASLQSRVEFEWTGARSLEGTAGTRGANCTSADALLVARTTNGKRRVYLFEWKYVEEYRVGDFKGAGEKGETRRRRYTDLYLAGDSPFAGSVPIDELLYEPYYQLMRLGLLGAKMCRERELGVDEARVVIVVPRENVVYRRRVTSPELEKRYGDQAAIERIGPLLFKNPGALRVTSQVELLGALRSADLHGLDDWFGYQKTRYGW